MKSLTWILCVFSVTGCASFLNQLEGTYWSKEECLAANWNTYGEQDGQAGVTVEKARAYYQARCAEEHQVSVDWNRYLQGHRRGVKQYCTREGGLRAGAAGVDYANLCSPDQEAQFLVGYRAGKRQFLRRSLHETEKELVLVTAKRDKAFLKLQTQKAAYPADETKIQALQRELDSYIDTIASLETDRLTYQEALEQL